MENSLKQRVFHALSPPSRPLKVRCQCVETLYLSEGKENQKPVFCLRMFQAVPGNRKFWHGQACQVLLYSFGDRNGGHIHSVFGTHAFFFLRIMQPYPTIQVCIVGSSCTKHVESVCSLSPREKRPCQMQILRFHHRTRQG